MGESSASGSESQAARRLADLEKRINKAVALIGELREKNYDLSGEVAALKHQLESQPARSGSDDDEEPSRDNEEDGRLEGEVVELRQQVEALEEERAAIRSRVQQVLERVEKLDQ